MYPSLNVSNNRITIMLLTYDRYEYAERTLKSVLENVKYSGELAVHIADDGSPDDYVNKLRYLAGCYDKVVCVSHSITDREGYGGNYNAATYHVHQTSEFVLPLEDDWVLTRELDLDTLVQDLKASDDFGMIRMGYVGITGSLQADFVNLNERVYLHLLPTSHELHVFSGHPRLEKVSWARKAGLWPTGKSPGDTEIAVSFAVREGILWPFWQAPNIFKHIGDTQSSRSLT